MGKEYQHISKSERLEISILLGKGYSRREVARVLGRNHSSMSREIRNRSVEDVYQPLKAQQKAYVKRKYSKYQGMKIRDQSELESYIRKKLEADWSPEQIAGRLREVETGLPYISHLGIYKYLYSPFGQARCHRLRLKRYYKRHRKRLKAPREIIKNRTFIPERPEEINQRNRIGDFEVDRIESGRRTGSKAGLLVVHERASRYYFAVKTTTKQAAENTAAIIQVLVALLVSTKVHSLTYDNDRAFSRHAEINQQLHRQSYFCLPHHPWEKGRVENTNKLIRQYIPKSSDVSRHTSKEINHFIELINNRPRKCLNYQTPNEVALVHHLFKDLSSKYQKTPASGALEG